MPRWREARKPPAPVPPRGILSQTLSKADGVEFVLFAFTAGEALAEHTCRACSASVFESARLE